MPGPLVLEFDVGCPAAHAFETWTERAALWWPADHTMSGDSGIEIAFEPFVGGRIVERTPDGAEFLWGSVTDWLPPERLGFTWHLGRSPDQSTDVTVSFVPTGSARCRVVVEQAGWERLGPDPDMLRARNRAGWTAVVSRFVDALAQSDPRR